MCVCVGPHNAQYGKSPWRVSGTPEPREAIYVMKALARGVAGDGASRTWFGSGGECRLSGSGELSTGIAANVRRFRRRIPFSAEKSRAHQRAAGLRTLRT